MTLVWRPGYLEGDRYYSNVELLLKGEGANGSTTFTDLSPSPKTITRVQAFSYIVQNSTEQAKFGNGSIKFPYAAGSYLTTTIGAINIRTTPFTMEAWVYLDSGNLINSLVSPIAGNDFYIFLQGSYLGDGVINPIAVSNGITFIGSKKWCHLCCVFDGTTYRMFYDGVQRGSSTTLLKSYNLTDIKIQQFGGDGTSVGYMDEIRITKNVARYAVGTGANAGQMVFAGTNNLALPTETFPERM